MFAPVLPYNVGMSKEEKLFTASEVAEILDLTSGRVRQMCISGEIKGQKVGYFWIIPESEVEKARKRPRAWKKDNKE